MVVLLFAVVGVGIMRLSGAASFIASGEAEDGALAGNYAPGDASGASGGSSVLFGGSVVARPGYYIDCSKGNDTNGGTSPASAWKTISKLSAITLKAGETAYLARGCSFDGGVQIKGNGTAVAPIVLDAFGSGPAPVISHASGGENSFGLVMAGSYQIVQNVAFKNVVNAGVEVQGAHAVVRDIEVSDAGFGVQIESTGSSTLVTRVKAHDLHIVRNTPGGSDDFGAVGYVVMANDVEVAYNSCINCRDTSYDFGHDGGFVEIWQNADNLYVHHNWAEETEGFLETGGDSQGTHANNTRFAYNVLINTGAGIIIHSDGEFALPVNNLRFENNTMYQAASTYYSVFDTGATAITARNNIISVVNQIGTMPATHTNNLFHARNGGSIGASPGPSDKAADPLFVNAASKDFHLQAGSPARGMGANLGYDKDYDGAVVPSAGPDAGAFQFH